MFLLESASPLGACGTSQTSAQGSSPHTCEGLKAPARLALCPVGTQQRRADNEKGWERLRRYTSSFHRWKDSRDRFQRLTHHQWGLGNKPGSLFSLGTSGQFRGPGSGSADLGWDSRIHTQSQGLGFVNETPKMKKMLTQWQL